jgi:hypothetical protein
MAERMKIISDEIFDKIKLKIFVYRTSYNIRVFQVVGRTKSYVLVRRVLFSTDYDSIHNATHTIMWDWIRANPPTKAEQLKDRYSVRHNKESDEYYLTRHQTGHAEEWLFQAKEGVSFTTVEY